MGSGVVRARLIAMKGRAKLGIWEYAYSEDEEIFFMWVSLRKLFENELRYW